VGCGKIESYNYTTYYRTKSTLSSPFAFYFSPADVLLKNGKWKHSRSRGRYLFKVEQLSSVFRARFVEQLRLLKKENKIKGFIPNTLFD